MIRYISLLRFTETGAKNIKRSTARAAAFLKAATKAGVRVEAQYWTVGACDGVLIVSADNEATVLRTLAGLAADGYVRTESLRALDAQEFAAVARK